MKESLSLLALLFYNDGFPEFSPNLVLLHFVIYPQSNLLPVTLSLYELLRWWYSTLQKGNVWGQTFTLNRRPQTGNHPPTHSPKMVALPFIINNKQLAKTPIITGVYSFITMTLLHLPSFTNTEMTLIFNKWYFCNFLYFEFCYLFSFLGLC